MTDAEKAAYTLTRQRIVSQIDKIVEKGGSPNDLKRLKRFGSAFSWYPEFYPQILADVAGMSDAELMSALRSEDKYMKLMAPVKGLPIHHKVANRTGGDIALRTPTDVFLDVRKMFFDKYGGFPGNSPWNLGAQGAIDERMHQGRYGAKGTVFDPERGLGMAPTPELPTAHGPGTKNIGLKLGQDPTLLRSQAEEIFKSLDVYVGPQLEVFRQIEENPVTIAQRKIIQEGIDPEAFAMGRTPEQSTAVRKAAEATGLDVQFAKAFQYEFKGGKAVLKAVPFLGLGAAVVTAGGQAMAGDLPEAAFTVGSGIIGEVPVVGDVAAEFIEGAPVASGELTPAKADPQLYVKQALQEKEQRGKEFSDFIQLAKQRPSTTVNPKELERQRRAEEARQRGGKLKFGFGGVKVTLPEFGLSELMGFN